MTSSCHPTDYVCRINEGAGLGSTFGTAFTGASGQSDAPISQMWKVVVGVLVLAVIVDVEPHIGGWLLLLIVAGLALSPQARKIIVGS